MISIQNIYYMLSYAFKVLRDNGYKSMATEEFNNIAEMMAQILLRGISLRLNRGLEKEYLSQTQALSFLRGKIDIADSIKTQSIRRRQLVCIYDDFSVNNRMNQIIKSTLEILLKADIGKNIKKEIRKLMVFFSDVDSIDLYSADWNLRYNRNNQTYQMLIGICYLVVKGLMQTNSYGVTKLMDYMDEQHMWSLYQNFIFQYYKKLKNSEKLTDRNQANVELFQIYIVSDNSEYSREFQAQRDFLASNNIRDIFNLALKTNKELFLQNTDIRKDHTYALEIIDYVINMDNSIGRLAESKPDLDNSKIELYSSFKKEIAKHRADGYITLAEVEEKQGSNQYLRSAQNLYYKANEIYSRYQSNYRNSYSNYENVKHQADLNDARDNYNKGMEEYRNAGSSKAKYRAANYYFREAQKYISNYKDTNKLLSETKEKGYFKYSLSSNNSEISSRINDAMSSIGYSVSNGVELFIEYKNGEYSYNTSSNTNTEQMSKEVQTGTDSAGKPIIKVFNFTKTTTTIEEVGTIHYFLSMRGSYYSNNINNDVTVRNTVKNVKYTGDVPPNSDYRDSDNRTLGSSEIQRKVAEKLRQEVNSNINSMVSDLKRI